MVSVNLAPKHTERNVGIIRDMRGFTLIEIMVVVIIIGTIAGLVGVKVFDRLEEARIRASFAQMSSIKSALDLFKLDNGFYPLTQQGLEALVMPPNVGQAAGGFRTGGYLNSDDVPVDPWQSPYGYLSDGMIYQIWSFGPDKRDQTGDEIAG
jgi:general secretion pathway protein G